MRRKLEGKGKRNDEEKREKRREGKAKLGEIKGGMRGR